MTLMPDDESRVRWDWLHESYYAGILRYLRSLGCDEATADDLAQETILDAARNGIRGVRLEAIPWYLRKAAYHKFLKWKEHSRRYRDAAIQKYRGEHPTSYQRPVGGNGGNSMDSPDDEDGPLPGFEEMESVLREFGAADGGENLIDSLRECVGRLPERARQAIVLQYWAGASLQEIADTMGLTKNGAKTLLSRTKKMLAECLKRKNK